MKPYSPETLGERWGCSAQMVRQMFHNGDLAGFRLGKLIRTAKRHSVQLSFALRCFTRFASNHPALTENTQGVSMTDATDRMTAWLYAREGGVAFDLLDDVGREIWRKQGRAALAAAFSMTDAKDDLDLLQQHLEGALSGYDAALDHIKTLTARNATLQAQVEALEGALRPFARCPESGKYGGRFVIAHAVFDDMADDGAAPRAAYWHEDDFARARAALALKTEQPK